jgi:hypothetical protein
MLRSPLAICSMVARRKVQLRHNQFMSLAGAFRPRLLPDMLALSLATEKRLPPALAVSCVYLPQPRLQFHHFLQHISLGNERSSTSTSRLASFHVPSEPSHRPCHRLVARHQPCHEKRLPSWAKHHQSRRLHGLFFPLPFASIASMSYRLPAPGPLNISLDLIFTKRVGSQQSDFFVSPDGSSLPRKQIFEVEAGRAVAAKPSRRLCTLSVCRAGCKHPSSSTTCWRS